MDALTTKQLIGKFDFQIDYEEVLEKNYSKLINPGDTVVDIGAHVTQVEQTPSLPSVRTVTRPSIFRTDDRAECPIPHPYAG